MPYRLTADLTLTGTLDPTLLAASMSAILRRHGGLRSAFCRQGDRLFQTVLEAAGSGLEIHDLRRMSGSEARMAEIVRDLYSRPLDVERGHVFNAGLFVLDDHLHRLVISIDHLVLDGRSVRILLSDLFKIHAALHASRSIDPDQVLPPLRRQYPDWAEEQWRLVGGDDGAAVRDYWIERLHDAPGLMLPGDDAVGEGIEHAFLRAQTMDSSALARADALSENGLATSSPIARLTQRPIALLSTVFALLHRQTGQTDLCIAMPTEARAPEFAGVIGHFVVPLILRVRVTNDISFRELFNRVQHAFVEAYDRRNIPIYAVWPPPRSLWRLAFNYQRIAAPRKGLFEVTPTTTPPRQDTYTDMDASLLCRELSGARDLQLNLLAEQRFKGRPVEQMFCDLPRVAEQLLGSPDQSIG